MKGLGGAGLGSVRLGEGRLGRSGVPPPGGRGESTGQPAAAGSLGSRGARAAGSERPPGTAGATPEVAFNGRAVASQGMYEKIDQYRVFSATL